MNKNKILLWMLWCSLIVGATLGTANAKSDPGQLISFNFRGADIDSVLQFFSAASGLTVVKDPAVTGGITIISPSKVTVDQAIGLLRNVLEIRGYTILQFPGILKVLPIETAKKESPIRPVDQLSLSDGVVTVVVPLQRLRADEVQKQLGSLFGEKAICAEPQTNTILITDTAARVMLVRDILKNLEDELVTTWKGKGESKNKGNDPEIQIKVVPLYYADASTLAKELSQILSAPTSPDSGYNNLVNLVTSKVKDKQTLSKLEKTLANSKRAAAEENKLSNNAISSIIPNKVVADDRSNSLIITGTADVVASIENLVGVLDESLGGTAEYITYIIKLEHADPAIVANILNQITANFAKRGPQLQRMAEKSPDSTLEAGSLPNAGKSNIQYYEKIPNQPVWVNPVADADLLVVTSTKGMMEEIERMVKQLDDEIAQVKQPMVTVYPLHNAKATELANLLNDLFMGSRSTGQSQNSARVSSQNTTTSNLKNSSNQRNTLTAQEQARQNAAAAYQQRSGSKIDLNTALDADVRFVPDLPSNSLLIIAPPDLVDSIKEMIKAVDVMPAQVLIEVTVVEVELNKANQFGVNWSYDSKTGNSGNGAISLGTIADGSGLIYNYPSGDWQVTLQALAESGSLNVLSNPKILATNNSPAVIDIGEQVPYIQSTKETDDNIYKYYAYKDVGITLKVTPRIGASGNIFLDLEQTVSNLVDEEEDGVPTIASRDATTSVIVKDGRTLVIGGLIRNNSTETVKKVPGLGDIPLLGNFFKHKTDEIHKTELLLFITPKIIRTADDATVITSDYQEKANLMEGKEGK